MEFDGMGWCSLFYCLALNANAKARQATAPRANEEDLNSAADDTWRVQEVSPK
jgi:hypothetical protein